MKGHILLSKFEVFSHFLTFPEISWFVVFILFAEPMDIHIDTNILLNLLLRLNISSFLLLHIVVDFGLADYANRASRRLLGSVAGPTGLEDGWIFLPSYSSGLVDVPLLLGDLGHVGHCCGSVDFDRRGLLVGAAAGLVHICGSG